MDDTICNICTRIYGRTVVHRPRKPYQIVDYCMAYKRRTRTNMDAVERALFIMTWGIDDT